MPTTSEPTFIITSASKDAQSQQVEGESSVSGISLSFRHMLAGLSAGVVSTSILHPLDLMKLRFAVNSGKSLNLREALGTTWRQNGVRGMYQGMTANVLGAGVAWGTYFFVFNLRSSEEEDGKRSLPNQISVATQAGLLSHVVRNPLSVVKTRLCLQLPSDLKTLPPERVYSGIADALSKTWRYEGLRGLYKGFTPGLFGVLQGTLQIITYNQLKLSYMQSRNTQNLSSLEYVSCAGASKILSSMLTYPYQVLKARMQDQHKDWGGWWRIISDISRNEGPRGFYRGLLPNLLHVLPNVCIVFLIYETVVNSVNGAKARQVETPESIDD